MSDILLSIVVPTKNRTKYLKAFIDLYSSFDKDKTELVIQDNSDCQTDILQYINKYPEMNIIYNYKQQSIPVIENSELAILHSSGKYVCFMGDDDLLSKYIVNIVEKMDESNIDSAIFNKAIFNWPGVQYKAHTFPSLNIPNFTGRISFIDPGQEYYKLLRRGATEIGNCPQLYHGIIKRAVLDNIKKDTGTFFPGPSPDMAVATCLSKYVTTHIYIDAPFISSGKSPKSAAGLGANHEHKGDLKSIPFLPKDIEEKWDYRLPFVWTGPTIYAQSAFDAIKAMGLAHDIESFDFSYFYAYFDSFCPEYNEQSNNAKSKIKINQSRYLAGRYLVFLKRVIVYIRNLLLIKFMVGGHLFNDIEDCIKAEEIIDKEIEKIINLNKIEFNKDI